MADADEDPDELSSLSEQESNRPKANAKIVGRKSNCSFFIELKYALGK